MLLLPPLLLLPLLLLLLLLLLLRMRRQRCALERGVRHALIRRNKSAPCFACLQTETREESKQQYRRLGERTTVGASTNYYLRPLLPV